MHDILKPAEVFRIDAVITCLAIETGEPLFEEFTWIMISPNS